VNPDHLKPDAEEPEYGYRLPGKKYVWGARDKLEDDHKNERISRKEYEARKSQIEKGSIIY
jgi:hypothetical protein